MRFHLAVIIGLLTARALLAQGKTTASFPPPGRLIDIGGRKLHLYCTGQGTPTVILVAGGGAFSIDWTLVQPRLAKTTRVCSYDRAGLAWSDPGPADETVEQTVDDLHRLLAAAAEHGPYVLVGASIGGIYIRAYQHAFTRDVSGLAFLNSSHRVGFVVKGKGDLIWKMSEEDLRSAFPLPASARGPAPTHEGEPFDRLPPEIQAVRLWLDQRLWERWDPEKAGPESILSWRKEFLRELEQDCSAPKHPLGDLPVLVLSSDTSAMERDRMHKLDRSFCDRSDAGDGLEILSSDVMYLTAGSGHEIHLYQPDRAVQALDATVRALRSGVSLKRALHGS
jgi:pimeloyl-ACP methyl ester carboxylesterase